MKTFKCVIAGMALASAFSTGDAKAADAGNAAPRGVDKANLDTSVRPQDDFYDYACGGWMKANLLKPEFSRFGTFDQLAELNRTQVRDLIMNLNSADAPKGSNAQKIADIYALGMDSVRLNRESAEPLKADIAKIYATPREGIIDLIAAMPGVSAFFYTGVEGDLMNSDMNAMYWAQGGLGLGDRDYYIGNTQREKDVREAYGKYLRTVTALAGFNAKEQKRIVKNVMSIETALAKAAKSREELRNTAANYNPMSMAELAKKYPNVDFARYFEKQGVKGIETLIVGQPNSLAAVDSIMANADEQALQDYVAAGYISSAAPYLSDKFVKAGFELSKVISDVQQQQPRWKRAVSVPNEMLGEAVGELYVDKYFPATSKAKMLDLVDNLRVALAQHITQLPWMSAVTKVKALQKLSTFKVKIGYPDTWRDYSGLNIDPSLSYWENIQNAIEFNNNFNLADFGKPVDRERWLMSPQTVNAYYNPLTNEICFPAGILQAPYFNPEADEAENYGAIGVVIGHEMTHGFDDQGREFDKDGNFSNWWTDEDAAAFTKLADALAAQFDEIVVASDGTHANGRFTLGENIADQGGLRVARTAYHNAMRGKEMKDIDGFTPDQRFYLSYANVWAGNIREAEILSRTKSDPHSLGRWRVNASLRNIAPFFEAFSIKEGDKMFRPEEERIVIW